MNISIAHQFGELLKKELTKNPDFYFFSPDETGSNKLDATYEATSRLWRLPTRDWDLPESADGRIVELLSENALFSTMVGHLMTGGIAVMASYEAFFAIILSQIVQQLKFFNQSAKIEWRPQYPAVNLLSTSICWRQDHNGYSHQSPILISSLLDIPSRRVNCFFPVDDIAATAVWQFMLKSRNVVNLTTFDKNPNPRWIDPSHAQFLVDGGGASIFGFISEDNPELIFTAAGDIATRESIAAIKLLRESGFDHRLRFVGIGSLIYGAIGTTTKQLSPAEFSERFATHPPIIANFHGFPGTLEHILRNYLAATNPTRPLSVHGYIEEGSTTTPLMMLTQNHASRYDLAIDAARRFGREDLVAKFQAAIDSATAFALANGYDELPL